VKQPKNATLLIFRHMQESPLAEGAGGSDGAIELMALREQACGKNLQ
jgi:hypothetical protein